MSYLLAIDSGNTRIKWGLHDGHSWSHHGVVQQGETEQLERAWQALPEPMRIIISNVAGDGARSDLSDLFAHWGAQPQWAVASAYQCGVRNYYADPTQLGTDRWASLIAAWRIQHQGCIVVSAGTAMTVDALSDTGEFLGGIIVPGLQLMQDALTRGTSSLRPEGGEFRDYPDNTKDAIWSGGAHALAGAVERMSVMLTETLGHIPECIISGGAASILLDRLNIPARMVDNLVLEGLMAMDEDAAGTVL